MKSDLTIPCIYMHLQVEFLFRVPHNSHIIMLYLKEDRNRVFLCSIKKDLLN